MAKENTCCFIGHRETKDTKDLRLRLSSAVENLIKAENVDTFLSAAKADLTTYAMRLSQKSKKNFLT